MISTTYFGELKEYRGLSTDEKPSNAANGSAFIEMDTGKIFFFDKDGNEWIEFSGE